MADQPFFSGKRMIFRHHTCDGNHLIKLIDFIKFILCGSPLGRIKIKTPDDLTLYKEWKNPVQL
ncbi:MAG: hypothetical protein RIB93_17935 [Coleofasciculus sp. D1-CHI-01]|uniref:hypothetical protein n=1 Tax=Coleofasciculus sp. D1-CHI-01 TaxID=3068482 RepID=UPI0032F5142B